MDVLYLILGYVVYDAIKAQRNQKSIGSQPPNDQKKHKSVPTNDHATEPPPLPMSISPASSEAAHYEETATKIAKSGLTMFLPKSGYFVAGAVAGGVSRTATAPLDRLKVYLLVNTKTSASLALDAAKNGQPLTAIRSAAKPVRDAIASLYKAGGLRTFFAGKLSSVPNPAHPAVSQR